MAKTIMAGKKSILKFAGVVLIIVGLFSGFGQMSGDRADDAIERGRNLQDAALSFGCIVIGIVLLLWKGKAIGDREDE